MWSLKCGKSNLTTRATTMNNESKILGQVVSIGKARIHNHLGELVKGTVEQTFNAMLLAKKAATMTI